VKTLILFDFDKTIINKDTGFEFIFYALKRNIIRTSAAIIMAPIAFLFHISNRYRYIGNSIFLLIATCFNSKREIVNLRKSFIEKFLDEPGVIIFADALSTIKKLQATGCEIFIVSGASKWIVSKVVNRIGLNDITIIASKETYCFKGMIGLEHCYSNNKIRMIDRIIDIDEASTVIGYTDSSSDIPLLSMCSTRNVINPTKRCETKIRNAFDGDVVVINWE